MLLTLQRPAAHTAAFADDQGTFADLAEGIHGAAADGVDQLGNGVLSVIGGMQIHRGQRGIEVGGEELIVTADERHILRYAKVQPVQLPQGAQRHQIVDGDQRRGAVFTVPTQLKGIGRGHRGTATRLDTALPHAAQLFT